MNSYDRIKIIRNWGYSLNIMRKNSGYAVSLYRYKSIILCKESSTYAGGVNDIYDWFRANILLLVNCIDNEENNG